MKRVTYSDKGLVLVLKVPQGVSLRIGGTTYRVMRWVVSKDVLKMLRDDNPDIAFVKTK